MALLLELKTQLKDRVRVDRDLAKKPKKDSSIVAKQVVGVAEDPTEEDPIVQMPTAPVQEPTYAESAPVKTIALEDGRACEIHGDERSGFEIRHGGRAMKSRFKNLDQANASKVFMGSNSLFNEVTTFFPSSLYGMGFCDSDLDIRVDAPLLGPP